MQTIRVDLPEDPDHPGTPQWAELRAASTMRAGDAKALRKAIRLQVDGRDEWDRSFSLGDEDARTDALLTRVIVQWSYDLPLPQADPNSLDELPIETWEALRDAVKPHREALDFRNRAKNKTEPPTPDDSSGSKTPSGDESSPDTSPTST